MRVWVGVLLGMLAGMCLAWLGMTRHRSPVAPAPATPPTATMAAAGYPPAAEPPSSRTTAPPLGPGPAPTWPTDAPTAEQIFYAQPRLMQRAVSRLRPQTPGKVDLYLVTFAGDGSQNVFRNEAEYAARLFAGRFGAQGHTLVLENNPASAATVPLATWTNLETALAALHERMDPHEDVLMIYLTSHGGSDHSLLVDLDPLPLDTIYAGDLADIVDEHPFDWKVLVVNACFSGGFIPPLHGDGTLVMTAASADRTSFGCGAESRITYFGDAFLAHALNDTPDFIRAFEQARSTIAGWEKRDGITPSRPQISIGKGIATQLSRWRNGLQAQPPVPFRTAAETH